MNHPESTECNPVDESTIIEDVPTYESEFEVVPIMFTISGLPDVINMRELKAEMLIILKRILVDLQKRVQNLKITNVQENLVLTVNGENENSSDKDVYFDISVVRQSGTEWGPTIISGLKDSYDIIIEQVEEYTNTEYQGYGINFNFCTSEDGKSFVVCSRNDEPIPVKFRLSNVPKEVDIDALIQQVMVIYKSILEESVGNLEITSITQSNIVDLSSSDETAGVTKDVFLELVVLLVEQTLFDGTSFTKPINDNLSASRNKIATGIQAYTDASTTLDLNWCIDEENAYNAACKKTQEPRYNWWWTYGAGGTMALPNWAVVLLAVLCLVISCCIAWCIISWYQQTREYKNNRHLSRSYLEEEERKKRKQRREWNAPPPLWMQDDLPPPRSQSHRRSMKERKQRDNIPRLTNGQKSQQQLMIQNGPIRKEDTEYALEHDASYVFDEHHPMRQLTLTNGEDIEQMSKLERDPDGSILDDPMLQGGGDWFVDEESAPAQRYRHER